MFSGSSNLTQGCRRHNYELDVNGLNYDGARNEASDPKPRAWTLAAEMPVRLTITDQHSEDLFAGVRIEGS